MRTPKEVVANDSANAAEHARSAAAIRRLAGGVRAQLATDRVMTAKERGILEAAAEVLDRLAQVRGEAAKLAKKHRDDLAARERAIAKPPSCRFKLPIRHSSTTSRQNAKRSHANRLCVEAGGRALGDACVCRRSRQVVVVT
jgi:hypothetical protein